MSNLGIRGGAGLNRSGGEDIVFIEKRRLRRPETGADGSGFTSSTRGGQCR